MAASDSQPRWSRPRSVATLSVLVPPLFVAFQLMCPSPACAACPSKETIRPCTCYNFHNYEHVECRYADQRTLKAALAALRGSFVFEFELTGYHMREVPADAFDGVHVGELYTYLGDFTNLSTTSNLFDGFDDNLTMVEIKRGRGLESLNWAAFGRIRNLKRLHVFSSDFPKLDRSFSHMPKALTRVIIQGGILELVEDGAFDGLEIRDVEISYTKLQSISRKIFPVPATCLSILSLRHNMIRSIPEDMFSEMPALTLLDVSSNALMTISEGTMAPILRNLRRLEMSNNHYFCDCNLTWVGRAFTNSSSLYPLWQRKDITCSAPPRFYGANVLTLTEDNLGCANLVPLSLH